MVAVVSCASEGVDSLGGNVDPRLGTESPPVIVNLVANWLVSDTTRDLLYASVPSTRSTPDSNDSIVTIDPYTGEILERLETSVEPRHMAMSDDGRYLYVALEGTAGVQRIDLAAGTTDVAITVPPREAMPRGAERIVVLPERPRTIAVVTTRPRSVVVFDDDTARPTEGTPERAEPVRLTSGGGNTLYGVGLAFFEFSVGPEGVTVEFEHPDLIQGFEIVYDHEWLVSSTGQIVDTRRKGSRGRFDAVGPLALDSTRAYFADACSDTEDSGIKVFDRTTPMLPLVGEIPSLGGCSTSISGEPTNLVRWGQRGLAFRAFAEPLRESELPSAIYIIRSALVASPP